MKTQVKNYLISNHTNMKNLKTIITLFILVLIASCSKDSDAPATADVPAVNPIAISSMGPTTGAKNTSVVLIGTGFSNNAASNIVTLNGKVCTVNQASTTQLNITIPPKSTTGNIVVTVGGNSAQSTLFSYIETVTVSTLAGSTQGFQDGAGVTAKFDELNGITIDIAGNLYVADFLNRRIRKITATGVVTTFAGNGESGSVDGTGTSAQLNTPINIVFDKTANNFFVAESNGHKIRKISLGGVVTTIAGSTSGFADGTGSLAQFNSPIGITMDTSGNLFVVDGGNHKIRKVTQTGIVTTIAGSTQGFADGTGTSAMFLTPTFITSDTSGNLYVSDSSNHKIRKITPAGVVSTIAGSTLGFADGTGLNAQFSRPRGIVLDASGNLYVCDRSNHKIRKISQTGIVTTIAGGTAGFADGIGTIARFSTPVGITIDNDGILYVTDNSNHKIRKIVID